jgi:hypothetical protein
MRGKVDGWTASLDFACIVDVKPFLESETL